MTKSLSVPLALAAGVLALAAHLGAAAQTAAPSRPADVNKTVPSAPPAAATTDRSARCLPATVNECRTGCERKRYDTSNKAELAKKINECQVDCSRAC